VQSNLCIKRLARKIKCVALSLLIGIFLVLMFSVVPDKRASSDAEIMGLWYRVAVTKTPEIFDISEIRFWKTTEATEWHRGDER